MTETDAERTLEKGGNGRKWLIILLALILLGVAGWLAWQAYTAKPDIWAPATVPYGTPCETDCDEITITTGGHNARDGDAQMEFVYNPKVDDDIAQYGDCLQSILDCVTKLDPDDADGIRQCVAASTCPTYCHDAFAQWATGDADQVEQVFYSLFIDPAGDCVPEGG